MLYTSKEIHIIVVVAVNTKQAKMGDLDFFIFYLFDGPLAI